MLLTAALTLATPLGTLVASLVGTDIYIGRNLLASLPALVLLIAAGTIRLPRPAPAVAGAALVAVLAFGSLRSIDDSHRRPAFREAAAAVHRQAGDGDVAAILNPYPNAAPITRETVLLQLAVPLDGRPPTIETTADRLKAGAPIAPPGHRLFLLSGGDIAPPATGPRYRLEDTRHFDGRVPLSLFTYRILANP
jgi:hypothetical protein